MTAPDVGERLLCDIVPQSARLRASAHPLASSPMLGMTRCEGNRNGRAHRGGLFAIGLAVFAGCSDDDGNTNEHMQELSPCFEWQRFMRHAGHDMTEVEESEAGEYTFSRVGFVHAGSWELNFEVRNGSTTDTFKIFLCVEGTIPFASCHNDDPSDDENCDNAIDVRCRDDEAAEGDTVQSMAGAFRAEVLSVTPSPLNDTEMATIALAMTDAGGAPITGATLGPGQCSGPAGMSGDHGHAVLHSPF